jgi:hypothetical protein
MDRKKILIILLGFIVAVGAIFLVARRMSSKESMTQNISAPVIAVKKEKAPEGDSLAQVFAGADQAQVKTTSDAMGSIEAVDGKTLTIKQVLGSVTINIDSASQMVL